MNRTPAHSMVVAVVAAALVVASAAGCSKSSRTSHSTLTGPDGAASVRSGTEAVLVADQKSPGAPSGLGTITAEGHSLTLWPYTGSSYETAKDPIQFAIVGDCDPVRLRGALMALDGNRDLGPISGMPPFNERWMDANGGAQVAYTEPGGWHGSVVQLTLGEYAPLRVHLRLWKTEAPFGGGTWTLGAAHFEVLIPGTADHEVLSWALARDIVASDLARLPLLAAPAVSDPIGANPTYRAINKDVYAGLPDELKMLIGGPLGPVTADVPLPSDGRVMIFHLADLPQAPAGSWTQSFSLPYGQLIPKPFCSDGPYDQVYVEGSVTLARTTYVDDTGRYEYQSGIHGTLTITPMDVTQWPPVPSGAPYTANISEDQNGFSGIGGEAVFMKSKRIAPQQGGSELWMEDFKCSSNGVQSYRLMTQCLAP
ncbi:MAG: hypothetical protein ACM3JJ_08520 [Hyphomicrobiales bacterium]